MESKKKIVLKGPTVYTKKEDASEEAAPKQALDKHELKNQKNNILPIIGVLALILVLILAYFLFFSQPTYKYSFNMDGVKYLSNEYTPSEFFKDMNKESTFFVTIDLVDGNANAWVVNSLNLWLIALNADHKTVHQLVKTVDSQGVVKSCLTNDANVLVSRSLSAEECNLIMADSNNFLIEIKLGKDNQALMSKNNLTLIASGTNTISEVNHLAIKQLYPDFDTLLAKVNEKINSVK